MPRAFTDHSFQHHRYGWTGTWALVWLVAAHLLPGPVQAAQASVSQAPALQPTIMALAPSRSTQPTTHPVPVLSAPDELLVTDATTLAQAAWQLERLQSLVVVQHDTVALALDIRGPDTTTPRNIKSLSKSVLSLLTGIAVYKEVIPSLDTPITELLGQHLPADPDPKLSDITIRHLLSMQSGLQRTSGQHYGAWVATDNWTQHALTRPFVAEPGEDMLYSTGNSHILGAILTEQTGQSLLTLMRDWLGGPLRLQVPNWPQAPEGIHFGGNDMVLSARAVAHLGRIYLRDGKVNDHRFVSAEWIEETFTPRTRSVYTDDPYGLGWFYRPFAVTAGTTLAAWYGRGYGGQLWYLIPELDLSIAILSDPHPPSTGAYIDQVHRFVAQYLIPKYLAAPGAK